MNPALDSRARFEALAMDRGYSVVRHAVTGEYLDGEPRFAWEAWQAAIASRAVPEGWQLVPIRPTPEMIAAADAGDIDYSHRYYGNSSGPVLQQAGEDHWVAMLAAAPTPPIAALAAKETT